MTLSSAAQQALYFGVMDWRFGPKMLISLCIRTMLNCSLSISFQKLGIVLPIQDFELLKGFLQSTSKIVQRSNLVHSK